jgi:DNA-binding response OmpR family regulator
MSEPIRVLIVDDEATVRSTLKLASRPRQWQVEAVESAEEALEALQKNTFDVALVDKNLPAMSGVELIREIRKTNGRLGIIMITAFASVDSAMETLHLGIDSYVEKPFDNVFHVVERVEKVAAARRSKRQSEDHDAITMHFTKAIEAFRRSREKSEKIKEALQGSGEKIEEVRIIVASPVDSDREWIVKQFGNSTTVVTVTSVEEALALARREPPELLLIDVSVPDRGLRESLKAIKSCAPRAGLIVLTAKRPPLSIVTLCIELGVRVILEKPLSDTAAFRAKLEFVARRVRSGADPISWSKENA